MCLHPRRGMVAIEAHQQIKTVTRTIEKRTRLVNDQRPQPPNAPAVNHLLHTVIPPIPSPIGTQIEKHPIALTRIDHRIGICHRSRHRFFRINRLCPVLGSIHHNFCALLWLRCHAHNIWLFRIDKFPIIRVLPRFWHSVSLACPRHHIFAQIRTRDQVCSITCLVPRRMGIRPRVIHLVVDKCPHPTASNQCCAICFHDLPPMKT